MAELPVARIAVLALGVALSPLPIVAVLIILLTKRARAGSLVFLAAWVAGTATAITIATVFAGTLKTPKVGLDLPFEGGVTVLLGIGLAVAGWLARRGRLRAGAVTETPKWVRAVDDLSPAGGAAVAFSNALTSPKNLALAIGAGLTINTATRLPAARVAGALLFVAVASVLIATPVAVYFVAGKRAEPILARWKENITLRAAAIMELALLILGVFLAIRGLYNLLT